MTPHPAPGEAGEDKGSTERRWAPRASLPSSQPKGGRGRGGPSRVGGLPQARGPPLVSSRLSTVQKGPQALGWELCRAATGAGRPKARAPGPEPAATARGGGGARPWLGRPGRQQGRWEPPRPSAPIGRTPTPPNGPPLGTSLPLAQG